MKSLKHVEVYILTQKVQLYVKAATATFQYEEHYLVCTMNKNFAKISSRKVAISKISV